MVNRSRFYAQGPLGHPLDAWDPYQHFSPLVVCFAAHVVEEKKSPSCCALTLDERTLKVQNVSR